MRTWILSAMGVLLSQALPGQTPDRFSRWDRDGDGRLTPEELPGPLRANFNRVDRDGDGFISREEDGEMAARQAASAPRQARGDLPGGVRIVPDLPYASTENPRQTLDLLLPGASRTADNPLPIIVFIHGGGWKGGDKSAARQRLATLVAEGNYACAAVGYRLSGEAVWPAQIHDCKAAIRWLRAHAREHGLDAGRIAVWGSSAGGHLAAMLGTSGGEAALEGTLGEHPEERSEVQAVVDFFGPSDLSTMGGRHDHADSPESQLIGGAVPENPEKARLASPLTYVNAGDAPFLIVHGDADPVVPYSQSTALHQKLQAAGIPATRLTVAGGGHGQGFGPGVNTVVMRFLSHHLLGAEAPPANGTIKAGE